MFQLSCVILWSQASPTYSRCSPSRAEGLHLHFRSTSTLNMPPIRRYLRITQYSVLECRIYLDNPADAYRWLLNPRSPVLPRVIEAVRPLVLPKLREENARAKSGKGGKRKGWKDVVVEGMLVLVQPRVLLDGKICDGLMWVIM